MAADLFGFFDKINKGDYAAVDKLSDDDVKELSPFVMLMWMHGAQSNTAEHVILTNTYCNDFVFQLGKHPRLLLKTFVYANSGLGNTRYKFVKSVSKEETTVLRLIARHYMCGLKEAKDIRRLLSSDDISYLKEIYE